MQNLDSMRVSVRLRLSLSRTQEGCSIARVPRLSDIALSRRECKSIHVILPIGGWSTFKTGGTRPRRGTLR